MIHPLINSIVLAVFGFIISIVLKIAMRVSPESKRAVDSLNFGKGLRGFVNLAIKNAEEGREISRTAGSSYWIAVIAYFGLIIVLILVLIYSPITMNWYVFLLSLGVGSLLFDWIFKLAKSGRIIFPSKLSGEPPGESSKMDK
jgi:hypothetical protein